MSLFGVANFYPRSAPDVRVSRNHVRREFAVEDLCVPLVAYEIDTIRNGDHELRDGTEVDESGEPMSDETGLALWPTSTLVVSVLMRCRGVLGSTDVLELGSGSGFCGLVARQTSTTSSRGQGHRLWTRGAGGTQTLAIHVYTLAPQPHTTSQRQPLWQTR